MTYTIDQNKLEEITRKFNNDVDPAAPAELVKSEICADWNEGEEHQKWINDATVDEIVDWLASFYN